MAPDLLRDTSSSPRRELPATLLRAYYAATIVFLVLDYGFGLNVRLAFLEPVPAWRAAYYGVCFGCLGLMLWRPSLASIVTTVESLLTLALLIIAMALRVMIYSDAMLETGRGGVTLEEVLNFLLASTAAYLAWIAGSDRILRRFRLD